MEQEPPAGVVFTDRKNPSPFCQSFVAGGIKLDIRRLRPGDVISIALGPDRQEQQNVRKLRGLPQDRWESLVNLIDTNGNTTPLDDICRLLVSHCLKEKVTHPRRCLT